MHADERAPILDPSLESGAARFGRFRGGILGFLGGILCDDITHDVTSGAHKGDGAVFGEILGGEDGSVLGDVDFEAGGLELL